MWKIGQKLVCVHFYDKNPAPLVKLTVGEMYTYDGDLNKQWIFLRELNFVSPWLPKERISFFRDHFRPVDETFGESVAEKLEKEFISQPEPALV